MATYLKLVDNETGEILWGDARFGNGVITSTFWMEPDCKTLMYWDYDYEPDEWASEEVGRDAHFVATMERNKNGKVVRRYDEDGYGSDGRDWLGYDRNGLNEDGHEMWDEYYWDTDENGNDIRVYEEEE